MALNSYSDRPLSHSSGAVAVVAVANLALGGLYIAGHEIYLAMTASPYGGDHPGGSWPMLGLGVAMVVAAIVGISGIVALGPNEALTATLFGPYVGTLDEAGLYFVNPFASTERTSTAIEILQDPAIKVNDLNGSPIEIAAVVTWSVTNAAQATYGIDDHAAFVGLQTQSTLRAIAAAHPYESFDLDAAPDGTTDAKDGAMTLRGHDVEISARLKEDLSRACERAGVAVHEVRISHLAYAPEIAPAMLRRQQARAVLAAQATILENAVGVVQKAVEKLERPDAQGATAIQLDPERKAAMVSNLLVVMVGSREASPVLNVGTIYG